jgi:WG containing repeat
MRSLVLLLAVNLCFWACRVPAGSQSNPQTWMRFGYINTKGQFAIEPKFLFARNFSEGVAWAQSEASSNNSPNRFDAIDKDGRILFSLDGQIASEFKDGLARVIVKDRDEFVDRSGRFVAHSEPYGNKEEDHRIQPYGSAMVDGERLIFKPSDGFSTHQRWGHFYEGLCHISYTLPGSYDAHEGYMDKTNQIVLQLPSTIKDCGDFHEDLAPVVIEVNDSQTGDNRRLGFINHNGALVVPPVYNLSPPRMMDSDPLKRMRFHDRIALMQQHYYIDQTGKCIAHFRGPCSEFSEGLAAVGVLVNAEGKRVDEDSLEK